MLDKTKDVLYRVALQNTQLSLASMKRMNTSSGHPGHYIKTSVLPDGLSVTDAAKRLGVGRPALSNMLNGNAALSQEMATRIGKAFGVSSDELLKMQADYERSLSQGKEAAIAVRTYVPSFLCIKASQIEAWSESLDARAELAALIRRLVNSTGDELLKVDFPAYENSQRRGWDGQTIADAVTPWIPLGYSGWEMGTNRDPQRKAENDFATRTKSIKAEVRKSMTFIFVTPRNWPSKEAWLEKKRALGKWKDVRAYDASDLEQWLEVSIPAQAWMAEKLGFGSCDVQSLESNWKSWAEVTEPPLSKLLFQSAIHTYAAKLAKFLEEPATKPLTVVANSVDEAVAGLSCLFESEQVRKLNMAERVIVVKSAEGLSNVASALTNFIIVMCSTDAERESAGVHRQHHTIIVARRNAVQGEPDIYLDLVDRHTLDAGLTDMGQDRNSIDRYARESGYSLTVLRRRLSEIPEISKPPWAKQGIADRLIPLAFVGAWDSNCEADQAVLTDISGKDYDEIESTVVECLDFEQSPVWSIDKFRGVISKVDAFYGTQPYVIKSHLDRFFAMARVVLSESDPALELSEDKRWAASLYGKSRQHSDALRQGLCETLVVLSVHGSNLFKERLGYDVDGKIDDLIRNLLTPFDPLTWQSQQNDLPRYAEAAPQVFLDILEQDLHSNEPKVHALLQPVESDYFSSPDRTGLLWALEVLAWNPKWLPRVVVLLGKLAELNITDNWGNRPDASLMSIFRAWMPQTAATVDQRIDALELLVDSSPEIGWRICIDQFDPSSTTGHYSVRPRWRKDAIGFGEPVTKGERYKMARRAFEISVNWPKHNAQTLGDLVERLRGLPAQEHEAVWSAIENWAADGPDDQDKAELRERIRVSTMTRRSRTRGLKGKQRARAKIVYELLKPSDLIAHYHWLFVKQWVAESADELDEDDSDYKKRDERIANQREGALREIWNNLGFAGITRLCQLSEAPEIIGRHLAIGVFDVRTAQEFVDKALVSKEEAEQQVIDRCVYGLLHRLEKNVIHSIVASVVEKQPSGQAPKTQAVRLLINAPFRKETWTLVDCLSITERQQYWKNVVPAHFPFFAKASVEDVNFAVDKLLEVDRPRAAFGLVEIHLEKVESSRLVRLMFEAATNFSEPKGHFQLDPHYVSDAFKELTARSEVLPDELARLEFLYIKVLSHTEHGVSNLEKQLSQSPELFVQMLAFVFNRTDDGLDPPELKPINEEDLQPLAEAAYTLLSEAKRVPGTGEDGEIDIRKLRDWLERVFELSREYGRESVAETFAGQLLGRCPKGKDGIWPHEAVREALEDIGTAGLADGMKIGHLNSREGAVIEEDCEEERKLAKTYYHWSKQLPNKYLFTKRLLDEIAQRYDWEAEWSVTRFKIEKRLQS